MRKFKLPTIFLIFGFAIQLEITPTLAQQTDLQPHLAEGICVYDYDYKSRYTCDLYNAVVTSPDDILIITGNHLPSHTDSDVQVVIHRNVSISYFNGEVLRKFTNLEYLAMGTAGVQEISASAFDVCSKLDHVYIGFNSLGTLPSRMLQNCVNLRHLDLYSTGVTNIPGDIFGSTTNLEIFDVSSNRIFSLPPDLLRNMSNLKQFLIRSNLISNVDRNLLVNAVNLEKVDLTGNHISDMSVITNLLNGHLTLNSIRLMSTLIRTFDFTFLSQFTQLSELEVGGGESILTGIHWNSLPESLTSIYLSKVGEEIPSDAFNNLKNLKSLGFTGDDITDLHEDTFKALANLESLTIQSTGIRTLPPRIFANQSNLTKLYLGYNSLEEFPEGLFAPLENLGVNRTSLLGYDLDLSGNRIRRLNANSFGHHPHLMTLRITFNHISEIERDIFARFPNRMETVDLTNNNCTDAFFSYVSDLNNNQRLQNCFNNWAGITTTMAPGIALKVGTGFHLLLLPFVFNYFLM